MQVLGGGSGTGVRFPCHVCFCESASETSEVLPLKTYPDFTCFLFPVVQFSEVSAFSLLTASRPNVVRRCPLDGFEIATLHSRKPETLRNPAFLPKTPRPAPFPGVSPRRTGPSQPRTVFGSTLNWFELTLNYFELI